MRELRIRQPTALTYPSGRIVTLAGGWHRPGAAPIAFSDRFFAGETLLVASDGLWTHARPADIARIVRGDSLGHAAAALVELVRLPSGALQDDVSIVLVRIHA